MTGTFVGRTAGYLRSYEQGRLSLSLLIVNMLCCIRKNDIKTDVDYILQLVCWITSSRKISVKLWIQACVCLLTRNEDRWQLADVEKLLRIAGMETHFEIRREVARLVLQEWNKSNKAMNALARWGKFKLQLARAK